MSAPATSRCSSTGSSPSSRPPLQQPGAVLVDATLGLGGHTEAVLPRCPEAHVVGIDRDPHALGRPASGCRPTPGRTTLVHAVYDEIPEVLADLGIGPRRGGALRPRGLLDAARRARARLRLRRGRAAGHADGRHRRADRGRGAQHLPGGGAARILRTYGEEKFARQIARAIVREREREPFDRSARLVDLLREVIPAPARRTRRPPGQAHLPGAADRGQRRARRAAPGDPGAVDAIAVGGRVVVMSYHSLEDRIVKQAFARAPASTAPEDLPVVPEELPAASCGCSPAGPSRPAPRRSPTNPRAASVRLRAVERVRGGARSMSSRASAGPRPAGAAGRTPPRRGRRRAGPADRGAAAGHSRAPRRRSRCSCSRSSAPASSGLLMFNTHMQQASFYATASAEPRRRRSPHASSSSRPGRWSGCATPSASRAAGKARAWSPPAVPAFVGSPTAPDRRRRPPATPEDAVRIAPAPARPSRLDPPATRSSCASAPEAGGRAGAQATPAGDGSAIRFGPEWRHDEPARRRVGRVQQAPLARERPH